MYIVRLYFIFFNHILSTEGIYEALELRDGGSDYLGKGVLKVCMLFLLPLEYLLGMFIKLWSIGYFRKIFLR